VTFKTMSASFSDCLCDLLIVIVPTAKHTSRGNYNLLNSKKYSNGISGLNAINTDSSVYDSIPAEGFRLGLSAIGKFGGLRFPSNII
jgi:hypothetical protein